MPSVPQSLLWISLVVLWLFVLVPMLISKRDAVRRTSDVALATRVLNSGGGRRLRRGGPAAGHRSDPDWQPDEEVDEEFDDLQPADLQAADAPERRAVVVSDEAPPVVRGEASRVVSGAGTRGEGTRGEGTRGEPDYLDVDVVEEDSGALPVGGSSESDGGEAVDGPGEGPAEEADAETADVLAGEPAMQPAGEPAMEPAGEPMGEPAGEPVGAQDDGTGDEYEYVEDTSGLESGEDPPTTVTPTVSRRRMYESKTAAAVSARKYKFRRRMVSLMALLLVASAAATFTVWPDGKWLCVTAGVITLLYLAYLRRQTRIEEQLRRRRMQRIARSRLGVKNTRDSELDIESSRLRRPEGVVLEIDDEDPSFEHLDYAPGTVEYQLPRAAGQ